MGEWIIHWYWASAFGCVILLGCFLFFFSVLFMLLLLLFYVFSLFLCLCLSVSLFLCQLCWNVKQREAMMALLRLIESYLRAVAVTSRSDSIMRFFLFSFFFIFFIFSPLSFLVLFNCYCRLLTSVKATSAHHSHLALKWQLLIIHRCFWFRFCLHPLSDCDCDSVFE